MNDYILVGISLAICFGSLVVSSRKSGYIIGYGLSFRDKYSIDKDALGDYCRIMLLISAVCIVVGSFLSQDALTVLAFAAMNIFFIGYAFAWEKIIELK